MRMVLPRWGLIDGEVGGVRPPGAARHVAAAGHPAGPAGALPTQEGATPEEEGDQLPGVGAAPPGAEIGPIGEAGHEEDVAHDLDNEGAHRQATSVELPNRERERGHFEALPT